MKGRRVTGRQVQARRFRTFLESIDSIVRRYARGDLTDEHLGDWLSANRDGRQRFNAARKLYRRLTGRISIAWPGSLGPISVVNRNVREAYRTRKKRRGAPRVPEESRAEVRIARKVEAAEELLRVPFQIASEQKKRGGYDSDDDVIFHELRSQGYEADQIQSVLEARNVSGAATRYVSLTEGLSLNSVKAMASRGRKRIRDAAQTRQSDENRSPRARPSISPS